MTIITLAKRIFHSCLLFTLLFFGTGSILLAQNANLAKPEFSVERGFYDRAFELEIISKSAGATIKYTLDGSDPRISKTARFSFSPAAIQIDPTSTDGRGLTPAVVVRATAVRDGYTSSEVLTHTYVFINQVKTQSYPGHDWPEHPVNDHILDYEVDPEIAVEHTEYAAQLSDALLAIPTISVVTDNGGLFDSDTGIYVIPMGRGRFWERASSIELINPDKSEGFQVDAGVRIRGGWSRQQYNPKHAFRLFFRSEYGHAKLNFPLFEQEGVSEFDNVDLRCSQNYSWAYDSEGGAKNTFVRDVFSRDLQREMGQPYTRSRYYHLYLNGLYWGLYQTQERSEASYAETYFGGDKDDYDVIKVNVVNQSYTVEATDGDMNAWTALYEMSQNGFGTNEAYYKVQGLNTDGTKNAEYIKYLDIDNLIDYMINTFYVGDGDGPVSSFRGNTSPNNFYAIFNRENPDGFKFLRHDAEHSMGARGGVDYDRTGPYSAGSILGTSNPQWFHQQLVAHPDYIMRFADRVNKYFLNKGLLTPDSVLALLQPRINTVSEVIVGESARWGDAKRNTPYTKENWQNEINRLTDEYVPQRTQIVLDQFKNKDWFPNIDAPSFEVNNALVYNERIDITGAEEIIINNPNSQGDVYYTVNGVDPRLSGGTIATEAVKIENSNPLVVGQTMVLKARVKNGSTWSAIKQLEIIKPVDYSALIVSEIHYNPADLDETDGEFFEFIELKNTGSEAINLALCSFTNGLNYTFTQETVIGAGEYLVLASNIQQFKLRYNNIEPAGEYTGKLSNGGETIMLSSPQGTEILSVKYNDKAPWPEIADGIGFSLALINELSTVDANLPENWSASATVHGTPGAANTITDVLPVLVSEVFSRSDNPNVDAVELYNPNDTEVNIGSWYLSDKFKKPTKWQIPEGTTIPAKGYLVFNQGHYVDNTLEFGSNEFGNEFSFSSHGDGAYVFSADQQGNLSGYTHGFDFDATDTQLTFGRYVTSAGEEHFVLQASNTLGAENSSPYVASVVINKIMYNPSAEGCEFIELLNIGKQTVNLYDANGVAGNWEVKGIDFDFPNQVAMRPGESVYLIEPGFAVNGFKTAYLLADSVQVFNFNGGLKNGDETITLVRPSAPYVDDEETLVDDYIEDKVKYASAAPWPDANANGYFLQKDSVNAYGNEPANWIAATTTLAIAYDGAKATENVMFYTKLKAISGKAPYKWELTTGSLPPTLALNETGEITGIPSKAGKTDLTVSVTDVSGAKASLEITIDVIANTAPLAIADSATIPQNRTSSINILANDTDVDGDKYSWEISVITEPVNGTATVDTATKSIIYTPNVNFYGNDEFEYQVSHLGNTSSAKVSLTIEPFNVNDYNALVAIFNALGGNSWYNNSGWDTEINNVSNDWHGVTTRNNRVVGLALNDNNLNGSLPKEIGDLTALEYFDVRFNPSLSGEIPKEIGNMENLEVFVAYVNGMSGRIPEEFGQLDKLVAFVIGECGISGTIPEGFGNLTNLIEFYIFNTQVTGDVPESFANLSNLRHLWLANNELTGLPDLSGLEFEEFYGPDNYSGFCVIGNNLRFDDINPNLSVLSNASSYNPQKTIAISPETVVVSIGGELSLSFDMDGTGNEYQWFIGNTAVSDIASSPDLYVASVTVDDLGDYNCKITNPSVPNLTLATTLVTVTTGNSVYLANNNDVKIYANGNTIHLVANQNNSINGVAEIYDISGKKVITKQVDSNHSSEINVANINGALIVKLITNNNIYTEKVIVK